MDGVMVHPSDDEAYKHFNSVHLQFWAESRSMHQVASSIDLEENSSFHVAKNIFIDIDTEELNVVLGSSRHVQVDENDDSNEISIEDCDGANDKSIEEEVDNSY